jgi:hypothetical protein
MNSSHQKLFLLLFALASSVFAFTPTNLAILDIESNYLSTSDSKALSNRLRNEAAANRNCRILEGTTMDMMLKSHGFQQAGCRSAECAARLGRSLNVDVVCLSSVDKAGARVSISTRLVDVATGTILKNCVKDIVNPSLMEIHSTYLPQIASMTFTPAKWYYEQAVRTDTSAEQPIAETKNGPLDLHYPMGTAVIAYCDSAIACDSSLIPAYILRARALQKAASGPNNSVNCEAAYNCLTQALKFDSLNCQVHVDRAVMVRQDKNLLSCYSFDDADKRSAFAQDVQFIRSHDHNKNSTTLMIHNDYLVFLTRFGMLDDALQEAAYIEKAYPTNERNAAELRRANLYRSFGKTDREMAEYWAVILREAGIRNEAQKLTFDLAVTCNRMAEAFDRLNMPDSALRYYSIAQTHFNEVLQNQPREKSASSARNFFFYSRDNVGQMMGKIAERVKKIRGDK